MQTIFQILSFLYERDFPFITLIKDIMKRLILTPLVFLAVITSCKKDIPLSEAIIGKWNVISRTQVTYNSSVKKDSYTVYLKDNEETYEFASSGTGIYYENGDVYGLFSWTLSGNTVTIIGFTSTWNITIDNDILEWTYSLTDDTDPTISYDFIYSAKKSS